MRKLTNEEFMKLKEGENILVKIGGEYYPGVTLGTAFYNTDADEPGWEIGTTQGFCDRNSLYKGMQIVCPKHYLLVKTDGYSIEYADYQSPEQAYEEMEKAYKDHMSKDMDREMSYISDSEAILYSGETVYVWRIIEI